MKKVKARGILQLGSVLPFLSFSLFASFASIRDSFSLILKVIKVRVNPAVGLEVRTEGSECLYEPVIAANVLELSEHENLERLRFLWLRERTTGLEREITT